MIKRRWISFKGIQDGQSYYPALQENTIRPILKSLNDNPDDLINYLTERLEGRIVEGGDVSIELLALPNVLTRIVLWYGDEELPPELSIYFDKELAEIISTEDTEVLLFLLAKMISFE